MQGLMELKEEYSSIIIDVRGIGLMVGMEMSLDCSEIVKDCLERGLIINCTAGNVLRFTPPLIVQKKDIDHMLDILDDVLRRRS